MACGSKASSSNKADTKVAAVNPATPKTTTPASKPASASKKVTISGKDMTVKSGEEFCVDVQVSNFIDVISMQYSTNFDSKVLEFTEVKNPSLKDLSSKLNGVNFARAKGEDNTLRFSWFVQDLKGISLYDGSTIYQVCFKANGKSGTVTEVDFADKPMTGEIGNSKYQPMPAEFGAAKITIE
ncbi:MAG: cohesin domain-containing protein [Saprospiraceae bacterium]